MYSRSAACDSPHHCTNDDCGGDSGDRVAVLRYPTPDDGLVILDSDQVQKLTGRRIWGLERYLPEHRNVYHDHDDCHDGKAIKAWHRKSGDGKKPRCKVCIKLG